MRLQLLRSAERWRALVARKLGVCPRCMRASLVVAIASWGVYGALRALTGEPLVHAGVLVAAGTFTVLFAAHVGAFFVRAARHWRADTFLPAPAGAGGAQRQSRRRFIVTSTTLLAGALLAPLLRLFSAPVLAQGSPPKPCKCTAPDPKPPNEQKPKLECPCCRCKTKGEPKMPPARDCNAKTTEPVKTSANGTCAGSLKPCGGGCTRTFTWTCTPPNQTAAGFHWEKTGAEDSCPTTGKPTNQKTFSKGPCEGEGCDTKKFPECGNVAEWTCNPKAGEGDDPHGAWTQVGAIIVTPACALKPNP